MLRRFVQLFIGATFVAHAAGVAFATRTRRGIRTTTDPASNFFVVASIFGPLDFTSTAISLRGGSLDCLYGGGVLDLRGAVLDPSGATVRVRAVCGGAQILVPMSWQVDARVIGLGGVGDARRAANRSPDAPRLIIEGWAMLGGFGIASEGPGPSSVARDETSALLETEDALTDPAGSKLGTMSHPAARPA